MKERKKTNPVSAVFRAIGFKKIIDTRDLKMWKNPNGCKNMTGILQNTNAERFFLTRYRLEFQPISALKKTLC